MMKKIDQKQRQGGGGGGGRIGNNNGFLPSSFRSISSYLRIVSSGASTVASTVRSAASAASTIVERDNDAASDQVLWAGFDKLECEGDVSRRVLLLGFQFGFQVWDVEDANNVRNIVSRYDGAVFSMQLLPKPILPTNSQIEYANSRPILVICADGSFPAGGNPPSNGHNQVNGGSVPTVVWFYSLKSQSYIKELKFRSVVYSVRCSSRIVAVLQAAQIHCFDVATLEREYTILTNPIIPTTSSRFENIGLGPLAVGPRWIAYSGTTVALPNTRVSPQHLTHSKTFSNSTPGSNGSSIVAHYAKQSSKQLAVGIVTLGDIGYKKLSRYYSDLILPDGSISQQVNEPKDRVENVGMVIVREVVSKSVIAQFKAHDSPIASLSFDPSGTLLVTASVHGHNFNVFQIMPHLSSNSSGASYIHLYKLQRGFTNAVIQDISFSVDSNWIMISSSRGTSHLFALSQESLKHDTTPSIINKPPNLGTLPSSFPQTLSAVSRIRSGNNTWKNINNPHSGVIASTFYKCKGNSNSNSNSNSNNASSIMSKYHMLVFSSSGSVIQYALRVSSSEVDYSVPVMSGLNENSSEYDSRVVVEPIQKWNICHKQNRREREENVDIYGENGHNTDSRRVFPERVENEKNSDYFDGFMSKVKKENVSVEERNHVYISEAELQMHESKIPLWSRAQIYFQSLKMDDVENSLEGEFEIEKVPVHMVEARPRYLVPAVNHFQQPKAQITRVPGLDYNGSTTGSQTSGVYDEKVPRGSDPMYADVSENGDEENGEEYASQTPIEEDTDGVVNSDSCPKSDTQPETVNSNRDCSVSGTHSELVNSNNNIIGQKLENQFGDEGD